MANPSLQIGNSNWAIKEDNLLGYSTAGTRFVPQPITMTRESAGTRVNSSGLVETVELLGSEEVTNGDFVTDSGWTKGTGWTISGGSANCDGTQGAVSHLYQVLYTIGNSYKTVVSVVVTTGTLTIATGTPSATITMTSSGTYEFTGLSSSSSTMYISAQVGFVGSVSNVSVKESTKNNLARVDYDGTASSLLVEPERTNLIPYSEDFSNAAWTKDQTTIDADSIISPDGTINADKLSEDNTSNVHRVRDVISSAVDNTFSVFAKKGTQDKILLYNGARGIGFDLTNGTTSAVSGVGAPTSSSIEDFGNGWYKCSITFSSATSVQIFMINDFSVGWVYQGVVTNNLYIWGAQLEEGSYPTSYIPNFGTALGVTRVQDQYSKTGISNLINSEEGVLFVEMATLDNDGTNRGISLNDGTSSNRLLLYFSAASNEIAVISTGFAGSIIYTLPDETLFNKIAVRYKANDITLWVDGESRGTPIISATIPTFTALKFDSGSLSSPFYGKAKQLKIYDTYLSNGEMQTLTT